MSSSATGAASRVRIVGSTKDTDPETTTAGGAFPTVRTTRAQLEKAAPGSHAFESLDDDESDDSCFLCGLGGEVIVCDEKGCGKVYHAICLGYQPAATDRFTCPQHYCCLCGMPDRSISHKSDTELTRCTTCPSAFCHGHRPDASQYSRLVRLTQPVSIPDGVFSSVFVPASSAGSTVEAAPATTEEGNSDGPMSKRARIAAEDGDVAGIGRPNDSVADPDAVADSKPRPSDGSDAVSSAVTGKKRRRQNDLARLLDSTGIREEISTTDAGAARSRAGASSVFRCNTCLYPTAHQRFAKVLEQVVVSVATTKQPHPCSVLMAPVTDDLRTPIYVAAGHCHTSLHMDAARAVEAVSPGTMPHDESKGADAESKPKVSSLRKEVLKFASQFAVAQVRAALESCQEAALVPAVPCCIGDLLAIARSCKYSSLRQFKRDLSNLVRVAANLTGSASQLNSLGQADITYPSDLAEALDPPSSQTKPSDDIEWPVVAEGSSEWAPGNSLKNSLASMELPAYEKEFEPYVISMLTVIKHVERALMSRRFKDKLAEADRACSSAVPAAAAATAKLIACKLTEGLFYRDAWQHAGVDAEPMWANEMLDNKLHLSDADAAARLFAIRLSALHPELSWAWTPYHLPQFSLDAACEHITSFKAARKSGATQALEAALQRAVNDRRKPILTGFGPNSSRWNTADLMIATVSAPNAIEPERKDDARASSSSSDSESQGGPDDSDSGSDGEAAASAKETLSSLPVMRHPTPAGFDKAMAKWSLRILRPKGVKLTPAEAAAVASGKKAAKDATPVQQLTEADEEYNTQVKALLDWSRQVIPADDRRALKNGEPLSAADEQPSASRSSLLGLGGAATMIPFSPTTGATPAQVFAPLPMPVFSPAATTPYTDAPVPSWVEQLQDLQRRALVAATPASTIATPVEADTEQLSSSVTTRGTADDSAMSTVLESVHTNMSDVAQSPVHRRASVPEQLLDSLNMLVKQRGGDASTALLVHALAGQQLQHYEFEAQISRLTSTISSLTSLVSHQHLAIEQTRQLLANQPQGLRGGAPRAAPGRGGSPIAPSGADGGYPSYSSLAGEAPPSAASIRSSFLMMQPKERQIISVLSEMAPMDVDRDVDNLATFLPPSENEVTGLMSDMSDHLRRALLTHAELRSAWTASRRAMMSIPAPVGVERKLLVAARGAPGDPDDSVWVDTDPAAEDDGLNSTVITLGEGRAAAELMVANRNLQNRCKQLEMLLAGHMAEGDAEQSKY
jgi:hypothetical protein